MTENIYINMIILTQSILITAKGIKEDFLPGQLRKLYDELDKNYSD